MENIDTYYIITKDTKKQINFKHFFNQPLDEYIPILATCQEVYFDYRYNQPVRCIPYGVQKLEICNPNYSHELDNLPASLLSLVIYMKNARGVAKYLPHGLQEISINTLNFDFDMLPATCNKIIFLNTLDSKILEELPDTIEDIELAQTLMYVSHDDVCKPVKIPTNLKRIIIHWYKYSITSWIKSEDFADEYKPFANFILKLNPNVVFHEKCMGRL